MQKQLPAYQRKILTIQGIYFVVTGIWPLVHMDSFLLVTGEKVDLWLVDMVGALAIAIGISLILEKRSLVLACTASVSFALVDLIYVIKGVITSIYLGDFFVQAVCLTFYLISSKMRLRAPS